MYKWLTLITLSQVRIQIQFSRETWWWSKKDYKYLLVYKNIFVYLKGFNKTIFKFFINWCFFWNESIFCNVRSFSQLIFIETSKSFIEDHISTHVQLTMRLPDRRLSLIQIFEHLVALNNFMQPSRPLSVSYNYVLKLHNGTTYASLQTSEASKVFEVWKIFL